MIGKEEREKEKKGREKERVVDLEGRENGKKKKKEKKRKMLDPRIRVAHILSARQSSILHTHSHQQRLSLPTTKFYLIQHSPHPIFKNPSLLPISEIVPGKTRRKKQKKTIHHNTGSPEELLI